MNTILQTWMEKVNAGDLEGVLGLYDESATLLPTFSPYPAPTKTAIKAYFENLASKAALRVKFDPDTIVEYRIGETVECVCGHYTFSYDVAGKKHSFASRFTFVINAAKDHPIIHHHSSQIPQSAHE
ncbi:MAG: DUF4440 domain-containing protein [Desulfobacterales bacterium]|nr:DUF4440 domain-containing protein [Desulfobacterales bacterium]